MKQPYLLASLFLVSTALAAPVKLDTLTIDGMTYKSVTISEVRKDSISIIHETGVARIPFQKLPESLQSVIRIPEPEAKPVKIDPSIKVSIVVHQSVPGGALCRVSAIRQDPKWGHDYPELLQDKAYIEGITGKIDGEVVITRVLPVEKNYTYKNVLGADVTVKRYRLPPTTEPLRKKTPSASAP
jgi:hypothetical protein